MGYGTLGSLRKLKLDICYHLEKTERILHKMKKEGSKKEETRPRNWFKLLKSVCQDNQSSSDEA